MTLTKLPKIKLFCYQGKDLDHIFSFRTSQNEVVPLTGYTARMEIRSALPDSDSEAGDSEVVLSIDTDDDFSTDGKSIEIISEYGKVRLRVGPELTAALQPGSYFWELEIVSPSGYVPSWMAVSSFVVLSEGTLND